MKRETFRKILIILFLFYILTFFSTASANQLKRVKKQTVYVPAYSHIYSGNKEKKFLLTVTLSIRNIDPKLKIRLKSVNYYETEGKLVEKLITEPVSIDPLESLRYVIPERDKGGSGANFIVEWESDNLTNPPIIESIMIGTKSQQGISFTSRGQVIITD